MLAIVQTPHTFKQRICKVRLAQPTWPAWTEEGRWACNVPSIARLDITTNAQNIRFYRITHILKEGLEEVDPEDGEKMVDRLSEELGIPKYDGGLLFAIAYDSPAETLINDYIDQRTEAGAVRSAPRGVEQKQHYPQTFVPDIPN